MHGETAKNMYTTYSSQLYSFGEKTNDIEVPSETYLRNFQDAYFTKSVNQSSAYRQPRTSFLETKQIYDCSNARTFVATVRYCNNAGWWIRIFAHLFYRWNYFNCHKEI